MNHPHRSHLPAALLGIALVCGSLAAASGPGTAGGTQPDGLDHFKCYQAAADITDPFERWTNVALRDQFGREKVKVAKFPNRLCNPVEKTLPSGETFPPENPRAHLVCWAIKAPQRSPVFEVRVLNQFGDAGLRVDQRQRLCLPSWKALPGEDLPPETQPPGLDHFKCYRAKYSKLQGNKFEAVPPFVGLKDQFESVRAKIGAPLELCNPVEKRRGDTGEVTPIRNPEAHLVCFAYRQPRGDYPRVQVKNQFGTGTLAPETRDVLCLPSFKEIVRPVV